MEFGQLMIDILVNVSCKFEMYIFKIVQVINENVRIAFLYVLSIQMLQFIIQHCRVYHFGTGFDLNLSKIHKVMTGEIFCLRGQQKQF